MKALVTCGRRVLLLDAETGEWESIKEYERGWIAYGITWDENRTFIGVRPNEGNERIDEIGVGQSVYPKGVLSDIHQMIWYDEHLWVMSSGLNQVVIMNKNLAAGRFWTPNPDAPYNEARQSKDWNHFNSIWFKDDRVYLAAHNFERPAEIWEFTYPERKLVAIHPIGGDIHNVCRVDGKFVTLHSRNDSMVYGRGLAIGKDYILTGCADYYSERKERMEKANGYVLVRDKEMNVLKTIPVGKGEVYGIRITDEPDEAHHGRVWHGL